MAVFNWQKSVAAIEANPRPHFLLAEERAIKARLSTISVVDDRSGGTGTATPRVCQVFYRYPERETEDNYPFLTIDLLDIQHNTDAQLSETKYYYTTNTGGMSPAQIAQYSEFNYYPGDLTGYLDSTGMSAAAAAGGFITTESFVPVNLVYQITSYARSSSHDRQIVAMMLRRVTPFRRGFIEVPEDGTIRRFDLLDWTKLNVLDQEAAYDKRIFRTVYTMQMNAEIPPADLLGTKQALSVHGVINVEHEYGVSVNTNYELSEAF